jgi:two-component system, cell cycle response regulator
MAAMISSSLASRMPSTLSRRMANAPGRRVLSGWKLRQFLCLIGSYMGDDKTLLPGQLVRPPKTSCLFGGNLSLDDKPIVELATPAVQDAPCVRLSILAVDDSPFSRKLLEHALRGQPYELTFAKDGQEALQAISRLRPNILITDWMLPDLSGPELCRRVRSESRGGYMYIILVTSNVEKESIVEGLAAGADDYLTKPFHEKELVARVGTGRRIIEMHLEIEEKNEQLEAAARTDFLTCLPNRRAVEEYAEKQLGGAIRHGYPLWVILADLNKFKLVNDQYGHLAGDEVLKRFAQILKKNTRSSDICGRLGGDEFVLVVTHVPVGHITNLAGRLGDSFTIEEFTFEGQNVQMTASFGVGGFEQPERPEFRQLLARADAALYEAKMDARVRVNSKS